MSFSHKLSPGMAAAVMAAAIFAAATTAQTPRDAQRESSVSMAPAAQSFPAPVNLKVLPKDFTGRQVHDLMEQWSSELGVRCSACHVQNSAGVSSGGAAQARFADDEKPMKQVARQMCTMTEQINADYIAKVEGSGMPVTCGTCHRGSIHPQAFAVPSGVMRAAEQK